MDIEKLRRETPGTNHVTHFNNAGASLMPAPVSSAITTYTQEEAAYGGYETARKYSQELEEIYQVIANFINAEDNEIAILENATAAWNMAFYSINFRDGDRILTSKAEYASNYIGYLRLQQDVDVQINVIPNDKNGQTSVDDLRDMMDDDVKLVSITHIPTNSGLVNPVEEIGKVTANHHCLYLVDACQSVGQYPVDVQKIGCDMLSATGRKYLRGPRGTGFLYVSKNLLPKLTPPFLDLHAAEWTSKDEYKMRDDARRFENWESNYAGISGLKEAVKYAQHIGIEDIWSRIQKLADYLRSRLSDISGITVRDIGQTRCGIVTFTARNIEPGTIQKRLSKQNINVNTSSRSSTLIDMHERDLTEVVRASVHYYNTTQEVDKLIASLEQIVK